MTSLTALAPASDTPTRDTLVTEHLPLAHSIARRIFATLPADQRWADHDHVRGLAVEGLVRAARAYDPAHATGASFTTFAGHRIRGRILDDLRVYDPLGRVARQRLNAYWATRESLEGQGASVSPEDIAAHLGWTPDVLADVLDVEQVDAAMRTTSNLDQALRSDSGCGPVVTAAAVHDDAAERVVETHTAQAVRIALDALPDGHADLIRDRLLHGSAAPARTRLQISEYRGRRIVQRSTQWMQIALHLLGAAPTGTTPDYCLVPPGDRPALLAYLAAVVETAEASGVASVGSRRYAAAVAEIKSAAWTGRDQASGVSPATATPAVPVAVLAPRLGSVDWTGRVEQPALFDLPVAA